MIMATHPTVHGPQSATPIVTGAASVGAHGLALALDRFIMATGRTMLIWPCCVILTLRPFQVRISVVATRNAIFPGTDGAPL
jgi:hypothetical protein